jgi:hypothetical protein
VDHSLKDLDADFGCAEHLFQHSFPRPVSAVAAAVKIESRGAKLGIRVTGKMRLRKQREPADAARRLELVPGNLAEDVKIQIANDAIENRAQPFNVRKRRWIASACIDEPFSS